MNYRHIYHAGNFADVFKHLVLVRIIEYLKRKDKAFRVYDTHAGIGRYDLTSLEAQKTGEWKQGIGRFLAAPFPAELGDLIKPYLDIIGGLNPDFAKGKITHYPGSPWFTRQLLRKQDRLSAYEMHPQDAKTLNQVFADDFQTRITQLDGWLVAGAHLPPKEKRGLLFVDPPFEKGNDFDRMANTVAEAARRWSGGTVCLWYPIKHSEDEAAFARNIVERGINNVLRVEFRIGSIGHEDQTTPRFVGCGMMIRNAPYSLTSEIDALAPYMTDRMGIGKGAGVFVEQLTEE